MLIPKECDGKCDRIVLADEADTACPECGGGLCNVEENDLGGESGDHVHCNACHQQSLVLTGSDVCIKCGGSGGLQFVNDDRPERRLTDFTDPDGTLLLAGNYWSEAVEDVEGVDDDDRSYGHNRRRQG